MKKTIDDFFSPSEAAFRWGISMNTLQEKLKPTRRSKQMERWMEEGFIKYFVEPGKKRGAWILSRDIMELWYGPEPKK